jgi:hypothetical protein
MSATGENFSAELFCDNKPLSTVECLEFILSLPYDAYLVGFFFNYDVTQILRDLPEDKCQRILAEKGNWQSPYTEWEDYAIDYEPSRYFTVRRKGSSTVRTIHEVGRYFNKTFLKVIQNWQVASDVELDLIERYTIARPTFEDITPEIREYCATECRLLVSVMQKFRQFLIDGTSELRELLPAFPAISLVPQRYQGPGQMASRLLQSTKSPRRKDLASLSSEFESKVLAAYYGGRVEISRTGHIAGPIYVYDINSAYPAAMRRLPCPIHTQWRKVKEPKRGSLFLVSITFAHDGNCLWGGLPVRSEYGEVYYPRFGSGIYWSSELLPAAKYLGTRIGKLHEAWQVEQCCDCHSYSWIEPIYNFRVAQGKSTRGLPVKLALAALYGKTTQHVGEAPYRNYIHGGLIAATVRGQLTKAVGQDPDAVIQLATDAIYSTRALDLSFSTNLGDWRAKQYPDLLVVQPGIFWSPGDIKTHGIGSPSIKSRGMPGGLFYPHRGEFEAAWQDYSNRATASCPPRSADAPAVPMSLDVFVGMTLAAADPQVTVGSWISSERQIKFDWSNRRDYPEWESAAVKHKAPLGNPDVWSAPYDPEKPYRPRRRQDLEFEALPDHLQLPDDDE